MSAPERPQLGQITTSQELFEVLDTKLVVAGNDSPHETTPLNLYKEAIVFGDFYSLNSNVFNLATFKYTPSDISIRGVQTLVAVKRIGRIHPNFSPTFLSVYSPSVGIREIRISDAPNQKKYIKVGKIIIYLDSSESIGEAKRTVQDVFGLLLGC